MACNLSKNRERETYLNDRWLINGMKSFEKEMSILQILMAQEYARVDYCLTLAISYSQ